MSSPGRKGGQGARGKRRGAETTAQSRFAHLPPDLAGPSVTVIITNHNYGQFLGDCINSALTQTWPANQVIVVDDGSTDGSARVLERYGERLEVVRGEGRGQAAAFNVGFARSTGDIVIFLDADDLLRPEAVEVVLSHHASDMALLAFGLETVDENGRSTGGYGFSLEADAGDNRPRLLRTGSRGGGFSFAPTSGNAFSRWFLARALPMPEASWRICADGYLVRAAALLGRTGVVRRVLGAYRIHGSNNYFRPDTFDDWNMRRGLRDLGIAADAVLAMADCPRLLEGEPDAELVRLALRRRGIEILETMAEWTGDPGPRDQAQGKARAATQTADLPRADRVAALGQFVGREATGGERLAARLARLQRPRWHTTLVYGQTVLFEGQGTARNMLAEGWSGEWLDRGVRSAGPAAALEFILPPTLGPVLVEMGLRAPEDTRASGLRLTVGARDGRLWSGEIGAEGRLQFSIGPEPDAPDRPVRLLISCAPLAAGPRPRNAAGAPCFILEHLTVRERQPALAHPLVDAGETVAVAALLSHDPVASGWLFEPAGRACLIEPAADLRFSYAPGDERHEIVLSLCEPVPRGWLTIWCDGHELFAGETGTAARLELALPDAICKGVRRVKLTLTFVASDTDPAAKLALRAICLLARAGPGGGLAELAYRPPPRPVLNIGQVVHFAGRGSALRYLGAGWDTGAMQGVRNAGAEASLRFRPPKGATALRLRLGLRPVLPPAERCRHLLGVSLGGEMIRRCELAGEGELVFDLPASAADAQGLIEIVLHSVHWRAEPLGRGLLGGHAMFELISIGLEGTAPSADEHPPRGARYPQPGFLQLFDEFEASSAAPERLLERRADIAAALREVDERVITRVLTDAKLLRSLDRLAVATAGAPLSAAEETAAAEAARLFQDGPSDRHRLRGFALGMLLLPAFRLMGAADLEGLPGLLLHRADIVAGYLGREPQIADSEDTRANVRHLERLLASVERMLDREEESSPRYDFAIRVLRDLRNTKALFGSENLLRQIRLRSRCFEKLLSHTGATLPMQVHPRPGARRLRLGVFVRNLRPSPEAWAFAGMYSAIDQSRFELVLITSDQPAEEIPIRVPVAHRLNLEGMAVEEAVVAIRALDLDLFVLGAYVANWERVAAIVAHRLARIQVNACFNCPSTLGFRSFDVALAWQGAKDAQDQHTERVVTTPSPLQCCFDFSSRPGRPVESATALRRGFSLPEEAVLLTSGAMAHKIVPDLMESWAAILARAPDTALVLYPFAPCWALPYAPEIFRRNFEACLRTAGVTPDRLHLLEVPSEEVGRVLGACDLYLDSFPYSGATTVCEALAAGLPVVTSTGAMLRARTGASWVRAYGLPQLVATSPEEYVATAARLATDPAARAEAATQIARVLATGVPPHGNSASFGGALSDALWGIAKSSGLFPGLAELGSGPGPELAAAPLSSRNTLPAAAGPQATAPAELPKTRITVEETMRVAVVTMPRSGSTLLSAVLGRFRGAEVHLELFHESGIQYRHGVVTIPEALKARNADPVGFAQRLFADAEQRRVPLVGFKLFVYRDRQVIRALLTDPRVKIICLYRNNSLAQYASQRLAEATGEWTLESGPRDVYPRVPFDAEDFQRFELAAIRNAADITTLFAEAGCEALFLEYNSILEPATLRRLKEFIGLPMPSLGKIKMHRQNACRAIDRFTNPDFVRDWLRAAGREHWAETC